MQNKHSEWNEQWNIFQDNELFLFKDWIAPYTLEDFRDKDILECGCGGGQHTQFMSSYAKTITAVDLNTVDIAREKNKDRTNIEFIETDIATMKLDRTFDIVISIGVLHHTDNPEKTVENLKKHLKEDGILILWVYSEEGNWMVRYIVEPARKIFLKNMKRNSLRKLAKFITALMYLPIYTVYLLPLKFMPYYEYFQNFRKLSFERNVLNVFDKLNAPQTDFISRQRAEAFVKDMKNRSILSYKGVSYSISGVK